jgi:hypothetical protein
VHTRDLSTTGSNTPSDVMRALTDTYLAVEAKTLPASAFVQSVEAVDWQTMELEDLISVMRLALQLEMIPLMRRLIAQATPEQMEDPRMDKFDRMVTKRVKVIVRDDPPNPNISLWMRWMDENASKYVGKWIALDGDTLLGVADSLDELENAIGNRTGLLVTHLV